MYDSHEKEVDRVVSPLYFPSFVKLLKKREDVEFFLGEVEALYRILEAYNNVLCGKRGRDGLWKFEGEEFNGLRVTIQKPSPRDLPDVSIIDIESKDPIPLSRMVARTRDQFGTLFNGEEGFTAVKFNAELRQAAKEFDKARKDFDARLTLHELRVTTKLAEEQTVLSETKQLMADVERRSGEAQIKLEQAKKIAKLGYWSLAGAAIQLAVVTVAIVLF